MNAAHNPEAAEQALAGDPVEGEEEVPKINLSDEFPRAAISWRAQSITKSAPYKAMALAYIDSRDVMDRLDESVGSENWQAIYEDTKDGVRCGIGIKIGDEWIWKWDAAPYTAVEKVKGGHSDAFKRAAVHWGIGRYLYALSAPWVPCSTYTGSDGKVRFSKFTDDPWDYQEDVDLSKHSQVAPRDTLESLIEKISKGLARVPSAVSVYEDWKAKTGHNALDSGTEDELIVLLGLLREAYNKETDNEKE